MKKLILAIFITFFLLDCSNLGSEKNIISTPSCSFKKILKTILAASFIKTTKTEISCSYCLENSGTVSYYLDSDNNTYANITYSIKKPECSGFDYIYTEKLDCVDDDKMFCSGLGSNCDGYKSGNSCAPGGNPKKNPVIQCNNASSSYDVSEKFTINVHNKCSDVTISQKNPYTKKTGYIYLYTNEGLYSGSKACAIKCEATVHTCHPTTAPTTTAPTTAPTTTAPTTTAPTTAPTTTAPTTAPTTTAPTTAPTTATLTTATTTASPTTILPTSNPTAVPSNFNTTISFTDTSTKNYTVILSKASGNNKWTPWKITLLVIGISFFGTCLMFFFCVMPSLRRSNNRNYENVPDTENIRTV